MRSSQIEFYSLPVFTFLSSNQNFHLCYEIENGTESEEKNLFIGSAFLTVRSAVSMVYSNNKDSQYQIEY